MEFSTGTLVAHCSRNLPLRAGLCRTYPLINYKVCLTSHLKTFASWPNAASGHLRSRSQLSHYEIEANHDRGLITPLT